MTLRSWSGTGRTKRRACCFGFRLRSGQRSGEFARTRPAITGCGKRKSSCSAVVTPHRIVEPVPFTLLLLDEWGRTVFLTKHEADKMLGKEEDTE